MVNKINCAVIGYGGAFNMGKRHAEQMLQFGLEFAAVCDLDAARRGQAEQDFPGIRTYADVESLLREDDIDLVTVITPHHTHASLAEQILQSGKHCILEKPMCIHAEDAVRLTELAHEKGKMLTVYHNRRWDGWYLTLKQLIQEGRLGEIFHVEMFKGYYARPKNEWRSDKGISGGIFYDWGAHYIDYLLGVVPGKVCKVKGVIHNRVWHDVTNEDQMDSFLTFDSGAVAHIQISTIAHAPKPVYRFCGTKGTVVVEELKSKELTLYTVWEGMKTETKVVCLDSRTESFYQNIADHLLLGEELAVKPEEARRTIAIIETTEKSALSGQELAVLFE